MKEFKPILFDLMKTYSKKQFGKDIIAGIIVAIIALPLTIALAIASGATPEQGMYTSIVAGIVIAFFGGSAVQISGPTAAFITIVAGIVATNGMEGLIVATILAGIILIIMGFCKLGNIIKFIPLTITIGFTAGIAVTIIAGQLKYFFGISYGSIVEPIETVEKIVLFLKSLSLINWWTVLIGVGSVIIMGFWGKISKVIPGSIVVVILGIIAVNVFKIPVDTIGDLYQLSNKPPMLAIPNMNVDLIISMLPTAITIAILIGLESLLSCVVTDGMGVKKHKSNAELIGQGLGNIASGLFGGLPAT